MESFAHSYFFDDCSICQWKKLISMIEVDLKNTSRLVSKFILQQPTVSKKISTQRILTRSLSTVPGYFQVEIRVITECKYRAVKYLVQILK